MRGLPLLSLCALLLCLCACLVRVEAQAYQPGLPVLFPAEPEYPCGDITSGCNDCTLQPACAYCYVAGTGTLGLSATGSAVVPGFCAPVGNAAFTAGCPNADRLYIPGQCFAPLRPGCTVQPNGDCVVEHRYNDVRADKSQLRKAKSVLIAVTVIWLFFAVICFWSRFSPYYGRWDRLYSWSAPPSIIFRFCAFVLALAGLGVDTWSYANNDERFFHFGIFGDWETWKIHNWYSCAAGNTNVGVDVDLCKVLPAAVGLVAATALLALVATFVRTLAVLSADLEDESDLEPHDIWFWRVDWIVFILYLASVTTWAAAHINLEQTYIVPMNGGPHGTIQIGVSWRLMISATILQLIAVTIYAAKINTRNEPIEFSAPENWNFSCCYRKPAFSVRKKEDIEMAETPAEHTARIEAEVAARNAANEAEAARNAASQKEQEDQLAAEAAVRAATNELDMKRKASRSRSLTPRPHNAEEETAQLEAALAASLSEDSPRSVSRKVGHVAPAPGLADALVHAFAARHVAPAAASAAVTPSAPTDSDDLVPAGAERHASLPPYVADAPLVGSVPGYPAADASYSPSAGLVSSGVSPAAEMAARAAAQQSSASAATSGGYIPGQLAFDPPPEYESTRQL